MSIAGLVVVALVILVGLVGIVVPVLPGVLLVIGSIFVWALLVGTAVGWLTFGVAAALVLVSQIAKYVVPTRRLSSGGVPRSTMLLGAVAGVIGFFVIPFVGLPVGFVLGLYVAELARLGRHNAAWRSTMQALRAIGLATVIELVGALLASGVWLAAVVLAP